MDDPCCPDQEREPHERGECMLIGTGLPGADRRRYLRAQAQIEHESAPAEGTGASDEGSS